VTEEEENFRDRLSRQSEETLGRIAEELAANPVVAGALGRAFAAREKASQAQEVAMGALGIPSAADVERMTRRLRSVSQRLEAIEDSLDRVEARLDSLGARAGGGRSVETRLEEIGRDLAALRESVAPGTEPPPVAQERLAVTPPGPGEEQASPARRVARRRRSARR
jgi:CRP-like cAMP-binding protein